MMKFRCFKKKSVDIFSFLFPVLIVFSAVVLSTFSKYYANWQMDTSKSLTSQTCYFEGDSLANASISSAEPCIVFGVKNYDSSANFTASDIIYGITVQHDSLDVTDDLTITPIPATGSRTLSGTQQNENIIKITGFPDNISNSDYDVAVSMYSPYYKVLEATYTITHLPDIASDTIDSTSNPPYVIRKIKTNDFSGTKSYTISWDSTAMYPDQTDPYLGTLTNITNNNATASAVVELLPNSSYELRFISKN